MTATYDLSDLLRKDLKSTKNPSFVLADDDLLANIKYWISTGCTPLDVIMNGGIPGGRVTEIYGPSSTGKSLILLQILAEVQKRGGVACLIDPEMTTQKDFMESLGVDTSTLIVPQNVDTIEGIFDAIKKFVEMKERIEAGLREDGLLGSEDFLPGVVGWDSVASTASMASQAKVDKEGLGVSGGLASHARALSEMFRDGGLHRLLQRGQIAGVFLNQTRSKIGVMYGDPTTTFGGEAIKFYSSIRLELLAAKKHSVQEQIVGIEARARVIKSKVGRPFGATRCLILFDDGIANDVSCLWTLEDAGILVGKGGWFNLTLGGKEQKFRKAEWPLLWAEHRDEIIQMVWSLGPNHKDVEPDNTDEVD
jgi:recombination protein RecA